jgi:hypothetical protein
MVKKGRTSAESSRTARGLGKLSMVNAKKNSTSKIYFILAYFDEFFLAHKLSTLLVYESPCCSPVIIDFNNLPSCYNCYKFRKF